jgi:hypothetical protein
MDDLSVHLQPLLSNFPVSVRSVDVSDCEENEEKQDDVLNSSIKDKVIYRFKPWIVLYELKSKREL